MNDRGKRTFFRVTIIYWSLLVYIVAALIWWFISLERQNRQMAGFKTEQLQITTDSLAHPSAFRAGREQIEADYRRNNAKYIGEGSTFLVLILIGAFFVYRTIRRQFRMQQQQQNFMMAVTHELKTPLSVAKLNLETLQKYSLDPARQQKLLRMTLQETSRLNTLTNNILLSSQLEGGRYTLSREEIDLSDLLRDCLLEFQNRYPDRPFIQQIEPDMDVTGDPLLLQMLINNLLENAIKYSPRDKKITCVLQRENGRIHLHVIDEGPGVPDGEKKRIFQRFYRMGDELTRRAPGTGLGLYLCRIIARDHHAGIEVRDHPSGGSDFTVTFHD
ncbi:MAG TPA: ATP-binding protein [Chitinophagaceae bacterium]|nr:ATP-binding protein [Chitinophagaceae bacterium]